MLKAKKDSRKQLPTCFTSIYQTTMCETQDAIDSLEINVCDYCLKAHIRMYWTADWFKVKNKWCEEDCIKCRTAMCADCTEVSLTKTAWSPLHDQGLFLCAECIRNYRLKPGFKKFVHAIYDEYVAEFENKLSESIRLYSFDQPHPWKTLPWVMPSRSLSSRIWSKKESTKLQLSKTTYDEWNISLKKILKWQKLETLLNRT